MKTEEDEAFEELAKKQGDWGMQGSRKHQILRYVQDQAIAALKEALAQPEQTEVQQLIALVRAQQITIDKLEMALADHPMREVQRLGQEIEQEPICPACKAEVLYECVACSSNNYPPPQRTEQEPFGIWHQGATDEESDFYLYSESGDVSCPTCIKLYTAPPQRTKPVIDKSAAIRIATALGWIPPRTWVGLTNEEREDIALEVPIDAVLITEAKLKQKNGYAKEKNNA
jgi:hypothetical protein